LRPLAIEVDHEFNWRVLPAGASPLLFEPHVDWNTFRSPNIIHDY